MNIARGEDAAEAFLEASRALVAIAARSLANAPDVTLPQFRALVVLTRPDAATVTELALELDIHPSTATRMCDRLVRKGLIRRVHRMSGDRREVTVGLTAAGRRLVDRVTKHRLRDLAAIAERMSPADRQAALGALRAFSAAAGNLSSLDAFGWLDHAAVLSWRRHMTDGPVMPRFIARVKSWDYLKKWLLLGALIGVVAGLAAIAFISALDGSSKLLLHWIGGYRPPLPIGEGDRLPPQGGFSRPWAIPLVVGLGGLISGVLVFRFAPEAEGHGTDAAIAAVHHNPRGIRPRVTLIKLVSSAATIGSGGSAGREGPTAQISAGFGSLLARRLRLSPQDARIAVTVGIGSGIGAIFRAPLGGAVLGTEILYRDDLEPEALFPSLVASIVGFSIFGAVEGFTPIFGTLGTAQFDHPIQLVYYAVLGVVAGLIGRAYSRGFYFTVRTARRAPGPAMLKPAVAGVIVGLIGLAVPQTLGTGYGWVQQGMRDGLPNIALWLILALPFIKIATTSLSIGSGGSGGIFGPGMVIGGFVGLGVWRLLHEAPGMPNTPAPFIVVGMISCFGSVAHAPLGLMLMVAEMTGSLALLPPAMIALGLGALVVGQDSIYESQLRSRADAPAHRAAFGLPMLASVTAADAMTAPRLVLSSGQDVDDARGRLEAAGLVGAPVADAEGRFLGVMTLEGATNTNAKTAGGAADATAPIISPESTLDIALDSLVSAGIAWIPVIDDDRHVVGIIAMSEVMSGYQFALRRAIRLLPGPMQGSALVEFTVHPQSPFAGATVAEAPWPSGGVALSIDRHSQVITPRAQTVLEPGDLIVAVVPDGQQERLRQLAGGAS